MEHNYINTSKRLGKSIFLCLIYIASVIITITTQNAALNIFVIWAVAFSAIWTVDFDFFHPYFWFSLFFTLYSSANAILWVAGESNSQYSNKQLLLPLIALGVVLLIVGPQKHHLDTISKKYCYSVEFLKNPVIILAFLTLLFSFILHFKGYSSKVQMRAEGDVFFSIGVHFVRYLTFFSIIYLSKKFLCKEKDYKSVLIITIISLTMFTLFTSERDAIIRYGFTLLLLFFCFGIIKRKHLLIIMPLGILAMVLSVIIKHYFLRNTVNEGTGNLFYDFLYSDFYAAGLNLQYLLDREWTKGYFGINTLFTEFFSPFLIGINKPNLDHWFNYEVHTGAFKGYAFTLVGTGYVIGGYVGIILVFIIVGVLLRHMYNKANTNIYWLSAYIYLSSTIVFAIRQSLQTITSSIVKHILLSIILCMIIDAYVRKKGYRNNCVAQ